MLTSLCVVWAGYGDVGKFIEALHSLNSSNECRNDADIQRIERDWYGTQPSQHLRFNSTAVGPMLICEYLNGCYFTLYLIVICCPLGHFVAAQRRREQQQQALQSAESARLTASSSNTAAAVSSLRRPAAVIRRDWAVALDQHALFAFDCSLTTLLLASYVCWIIYLSWPVAGPLWCLSPRYASCSDSHALWLPDL